MSPEPSFPVAWRETLARKYPTESEAREFVDRIELLRPSRIAFQPRADLTWFSIYEEARKLSGRCIERILDEALADFPDDDALRHLRDGERIDFPDGKAVDWRGAPGAALERIMGAQSALVPISFLEKGLVSAQAVARVCCGANRYGSGFLIQGDLLVTNHHVIHDAAEAAGARVEFNFQRTIDGLAARTETVACDVSSYFFSSVTDDFTIVKLTGEPSRRFAPLRLQPISVRVNDRVNIIQHAGGQEKQLSYFHNVVAYVGAGRVQYLTDTLPGSSGSPVFDKDWRVVALHHSGGWIPEPGMRSAASFRNEGIDINLVIATLDRDKR